MPRPSPSERVTLCADVATAWTEGAYAARRLQGNVVITQGTSRVRAADALVLVDQAETFDQPTKLIVYVEGTALEPVSIETHEATVGEVDPPDDPLARQQAPAWFGRFFTRGGIVWRTPPPGPAPAEQPGVVTRGRARLGPETSVVQPAQFDAPLLNASLTPGPLVPSPGPMTPEAHAFRRVRIFRRSDVGANIEFRQLPNGQSVAIVTNGVNVVVEGLRLEGLPGEFGQADQVDLETDRAVIWAGGVAGLGVDFQQQNDVPLEIYMEGNIVFRQGERIVYADRMYYDVRRRTGVVLNAELLTPLPKSGEREYRGLVRLKAGVLRQLDESRFVASDALLTTSRLEAPQYSLRSDTITFEDLQQPRGVDPATGVQKFGHQRLARSQDNFVYLGETPVFYWPTLATDLEEPRYYVDDFRVGNDSVYGFQTMLDLDVHQIFGAPRIPGTDWTVGLDYLSQRGWGYGSAFEYDIDRFFGVIGPTEGRADLWAIDDRGVDNLGFNRRAITPEKSYRGRAYWNHKQDMTEGLLAGWNAQGEVGWISDRTFLEQYYESEWDENKDQTTGLRLKRLNDNRALSIEANARLNDFFTQTQWLPRLDHYVLGQDFLGDSMTWFAHSQAAYANLKVATDPANPQLNYGLPAFPLHPWEVDPAAGIRVDGTGERLATRQEIDLPIDLTPVKIVPYAIGELAHWGADINGNEIDRAFIHTGVRASVPFWAVNPAIRDSLFNLNGLAHKVVFDAELWYADATRNFDQFPLYDELEDDAFEEMRRSYYSPLFGGRLASAGYYVPGAVPFIDPRFDPRFYAIRSGIQGSVTSPTTELVEDQKALRFGMRHRLQTKRGAPGRQHIVDWVTFDANATWFPDENRDNLGQQFGLIDYDLVWHLGDRFSILSDGYADTFADGLQTFSGGVRINRPERGNLYLGYRTLRGPFDADLITAALNYRLGPKWVGAASAVLDFNEAGSIGQSFLLSRIGESLIVSIGANVDESKGNVGFNFLVEPRFLPSLNLTRRTGVDIPPPGYYGLE